MTFDLDSRNGWPEELLTLLKQHPRNTWRSARSPVAQFWLDRHDEFRRQCEALEALTTDYRRERLDAHAFAMRAAPRTHHLVAHLEGHHQIEDFHYFPFFRTEEPSLGSGFDALDRDHQTLHSGIVAVLDALDALRATIGPEAGAEPSVATRRAADRVVAESLTLYRRLVRHLHDEEDLIIPLMLERG